MIKDCHKPNPLIFRRVIIPAALGDDKENPPENGAYCNALVIYEANNAMYLYSSDGIPTEIPTSITSYNNLTHKPSINGVELEGDISLEELGISGLIEGSVASEATARADADEALQDAIDAEEAARIAADQDIIGSIPTVNDAALTIQRNGTSAGIFTANSASDTTINIDVPIYTSGLINDSGYVTEAALSGYATDQEIENAVSAEATIRAATDQDLQTQIDAISSASDVVDVVGTYAELQSYDTSKLGDNDIIKVLTDETHDDAISYYRFNKRAGTWTYIGSQGPFYTKSETDATFVPQTRTVNGKALSTDIVLTATDVNALPASTVIPTVNNATLTIKRNGNNVASFTANSASDVSADIAVPTKTSNLTNDSNFVSDANYVHTDNNFTTILKDKLDGIATGAEVNVQSDWSQINASADDYIKNKPSIPTKTSDLTNDSGYISTLPVASANTLGAIKVGTNLSITADGTLSADAQSITVDSALSSTSTNPVENRVINTALNAKADAASLASVATSGDYTDLTNKPTIPTVNNATLTIQRNSATIDTFTANSAQDKTINIAVPTATSDLTNDSGFLTSIPTASASTLGGIKVGAGLSITNGVLSATGGGVADAVEWAKVLNKPTNVSYWTNDAGYITSSALPTKTSDLTNDGSDGSSTYVEADELSAVATSGSYNDLTDKPTIPAVNDATLTIQRNGVNIDSFTANASQNKSINVVVPIKTSDLTNDSDFVSDANYVHTDNNFTTILKDKLDGIAAGAEVNVQSDWSVTDTASDAFIKNKPAIPTVNNGQLTIQKNGSNVATFTANQGTNATANITVPTKTSDLTNDSGFIDTVAWGDVTGKPTFATVATSGSYNDLSNKPTIPTVKGQSIYYATCPTSASTQTKVATTTSGDFTLTAGNMVRVSFANGNTHDTVTKLNVDGTGAVDIYKTEGSNITQYFWAPGQCVDFAYDGTKFIMSNMSPAGTSYYGVTKLEDSITSSSTTTAATAKAVKTVADMVPTKTSDLTNDSGFIDTVDSALSTTSTNPVQNKVVAQAINDANALIDNKISYGDVQTSDIATGAVTNIKIGNSAVTADKIADGAVTSSKIDWTTIGETVNGTTSSSVPINYAWKYPDGRLICFQRYVWSGKSVKKSWGSCYTGIFMTPTNYAVPFTATPLASATPNLTAGGNVWVASNGENGYTSKTKPGAFQLVRPNSTSSSDGYLDIVAYGYWK